MRAALADALADLPDAPPRDLVLLLARDPALEVCEPLIRLSRALRDDGLLALIEDPPGPSHAAPSPGAWNWARHPVVRCCAAERRSGGPCWRTGLPVSRPTPSPPCWPTQAACPGCPRRWLSVLRQGLLSDLLLLARDARNLLLGRPDLLAALREALASRPPTANIPIAWNR
ncbi:hypothetical protein [Sabulicella rubraurantiaca]|uniref:hypothetical protein n=1 Tax=Sabulicella rubraurantiaca TaxID=2811429 RepID=UPI001A9772E3|nr:hypothetical protein [Sabulicella rubraurantiaca]